MFLENYPIMRRKKIIIAILVIVMMALAVLIFGLWHKDILLRYFRPLIADNIITIQKIRKLSDILFIREKLFGVDTLGTYELEINGRDFEKLNANLPRGTYTVLEAEGEIIGAISNVQGEDRNISVPAKFIYNGAKYDVKVKYRGVSYNHWFYPKKSWGVTFKDQSPIGIQSLDLIIPEDRGYLNEEFNHYRARKLGLIVPESGFVNLKVNGAAHGIYWWVEDWSEEMLAKNERSVSGCIFGARPAGSISKKDIFWNEYTGNCVGESPLLEPLFRLLQVDDISFAREAPKVLDIERILRWEALTRLAGTSDATHGYNQRIYFNDITKKFEFIPWDVSIEKLGAQVDAPYDELITRLLSVKGYHNRRNEILETYLNDKNIKDDLAFYDRLLSNTEIAFYRDALKNESNLEFREKIRAGRSIILDNITTIQATLGIVAGGVADAAADATPRVEYEEILAVPEESRDEVWAYLSEHFGDGAGEFQTRVETEYFTDIYFDTRALALLDQEAIVRYRTRSRDDKEPLVQVKTGGNVISRGEWKFAVKADTPATAGPLVGRIVNKEQKEFADKLATLGIRAEILNPVLELAQERRRIYFSENGKDILTVSLDLASAERLWAEAEFASIDIELNEVAYTVANEARRAELRRVAEQYAADITAQFPRLTPDRAPKYIKAFAALAEQIPLYRFLVGVGVL